MLYLVEKATCVSCCGQGVKDGEFFCGICNGEGVVVVEERLLSPLEGALLNHKREIAAIVAQRPDAGRLLGADRPDRTDRRDRPVGR